MTVRSHIGSKAPFQFLHVQVHQNCRKLNLECFSQTPSNIIEWAVYDQCEPTS
jgi:hypothetical protein